MTASGARSIRPDGGDGDEKPSPPPPKMTTLRELQLVEAGREGDPAAMAELLRAYQKRIWGVCYRMVRDADEAADLTQDALVKIMEGLGSYDGRSALSTWMIRVTMNCCLSHLRRQRIRRHGSLDAPSGPDDASWAARLPAEGEPSAIQRVEQTEMRAILLRALKGLDPQMRAVIVLRDLQDLDYQQIGEVLGVPIGTVKSRLFRARAALRAAAETEMDRPADTRPPD